MSKCKDCVVGLFGVCGVDYCRQERKVLIKEAQQTAEQCGHTLTQFVKLKDYAIWEARCIRCERLAAIKLDPTPNEPDIYGEALAVNCPQIDGEQIAARSDEETP